MLFRRRSVKSFFDFCRFKDKNWRVRLGSRRASFTGDRSIYKPHQGTKERERRRKQAARMKK